MDIISKITLSVLFSPPSRLVPLVQGLSHQVHLFLVEYNKCSRLRLDLPGYRDSKGGLSSSNGANGRSQV